MERKWLFRKRWDAEPPAWEMHQASFLLLPWGIPRLETTPGKEAETEKRIGQCEGVSQKNCGASANFKKKFSSWVFDPQRTHPSLGGGGTSKLKKIPSSPSQLKNKQQKKQKKYPENCKIHVQNDGKTFIQSWQKLLDVKPPAGCSPTKGIAFNPNKLIRRQRMRFTLPQQAVKQISFFFALSCCHIR